jgi:hypothetical protein
MPSVNPIHPDNTLLIIIISIVLIVMFMMFMMFMMFIMLMMFMMFMAVPVMMDFLNFNHPCYGTYHRNIHHSHTNLIIYRAAALLVMETRPLVRQAVANNGTRRRTDSSGNHLATSTPHLVTQQATRNAANNGPFITTGTVRHPLSTAFLPGSALRGVLNPLARIDNNGQTH